MKKISSVESLVEQGYEVSSDISWMIEDSLKNGNEVYHGGTNGEVVVMVQSNGDEFEIGRIKKVIDR